MFNTSTIMHQHHAQTKTFCPVIYFLPKNSQKLNNAKSGEYGKCIIFFQSKTEELEQPYGITHYHDLSTSGKYF